MTRRMHLPRFARPTSRLMMVAVGALLLTLSLVIPADADDEISITPDEPMRGEPGSIWTVAEEPVPAELVGVPCDLRVVAENGSSVHPGNTVITTTGASRSVFEGVEDSADGSLVAVERVTLGQSILVELQLGPDGASSLGFTIGFECTPDALLPPVLPAQQVPEDTPSDDSPELPEAPPAQANVEDPTYTG
jgi:hypothetical protein